MLDTGFWMLVSRLNQSFKSRIEDPASILKLKGVSNVTFSRLEKYMAKQEA
jgi:hypothetical protein